MTKLKYGRSRKTMKYRGKYSLKKLLHEGEEDFEVQNATALFGDNDRTIRSNMKRREYTPPEGEASARFASRYSDQDLEALAGVYFEVDPSSKEPIGHNEISIEDFESLKKKKRRKRKRTKKGFADAPLTKRLSSLRSKLSQQIKDVGSTEGNIPERFISTLSVGAETFEIPNKGMLYGDVLGALGNSDQAHEIYKDMYRMTEIYQEYVSMGSTAIGDWFEDLCASVWDYRNTNIRRRGSEGVKKSEFADVFGDNIQFSVKGSAGTSDGLSASRVKLKSTCTALYNLTGGNGSVALGVIEGGTGLGGERKQFDKTKYVVFHMRKSGGIDTSFSKIDKLSTDEFEYFKLQFGSHKPVLIKKKGGYFAAIENTEKTPNPTPEELEHIEANGFSSTVSDMSALGFSWHNDDHWNWGAFESGWMQLVGGSAERVIFILPIEENAPAQARTLRRAAMGSVGDQRYQYRADQWTEEEEPDFSSFISDENLGERSRTDIDWADLNDEEKEEYKAAVKTWSEKNDVAYKSALKGSIQRGRLASKIKKIALSLSKFEEEDQGKLKAIIDDLYEKLASQLDEGTITIEDIDETMEKEVLKEVKHSRFMEWAITGKRK